VSEQEKTQTDSQIGKGKTLTIGAVCKALQSEFPDVSISKIRYLEGQKLITPTRSSGGYRKYSTADVAQLRTVLRLQRDEFLPLDVIRKELTAGRNGDDRAGIAPLRSTRTRPNLEAGEQRPRYPVQEVLEATGASQKFIRELEEYGIIKGEMRAGALYYDDVDQEVIRAAVELARYGVSGRNLRLFRSSTDREAALIEQILGPALKSRNPERRKEAVARLDKLAEITSHLRHQLLVRDLRKMVG